MLYIVATGFLLAARLSISPSFGEGGFASSPGTGVSPPIQEVYRRRHILPSI